MCTGYDPFKWADIYNSEEEYFNEWKVESGKWKVVNIDLLTCSPVHLLTKEESEENK